MARARPKLPITGQANALFNLGVSLRELGDTAQAITNAEEALEIYTRIEDPHAAGVQERLRKWRTELLK
jgi:hypothetical protein